MGQGSDAQSRLWAWGWNQDGEVGNGVAAFNVYVPLSVVGPDGIGILTDVTAVGAGRAHSIALKSDGTVWAWGTNMFGQLGTGTISLNRPFPGQVTGANGVGYLTSVSTIISGWDSSFAFSEDGTLWSWGALPYDETSVYRYPYPTHLSDVSHIESLTNIASISDGRYSICALLPTGAIWTWGFNEYGQLGDGTMVFRNSPVQVQSLENIVSVTAGIHHKVALMSNGTVWAWGRNDYGQLGDGTTVLRSVPVQVLGSGAKGVLTDIIAVSAGLYHTAALKSDGTVWTWGRNDVGRLGNGTTTQSETPVQVVSPHGEGYLTNICTPIIFLNRFRALLIV